MTLMEMSVEKLQHDLFLEADLWPNDEDTFMLSPLYILNPAGLIFTTENISQLIFN